MKVIAETRRVH